MRLSRFFAISSAIVGAASSTAHADNQAATFDVQIRILPRCAASTGFLKSEKDSGAEQNQARITITCSEDSPWSVRMIERAGKSATSLPGGRAVSGIGSGMIIPDIGPLADDRQSYADIIAVDVTY
ncbi:hypothetical protein [Parasphingorhabdus sp.]|uniref:hypothetical protein n=1 Tax=Parasphingorhabdus sp. TaxID=2709688 RepID=UPI002F92E65F